jgi:drug/metabolite transporter (DMT)-like permease
MLKELRNLTTSQNRAVSRTKLIAAFAAVYFVWGSTYLFIHFALEGFQPFLLGAVRFLIAGAILFAWTRQHGDPLPTRKQLVSCIITGGLFFLCGNGAVIWAQQRLASGLVALIVAIVPLFVVVLDWIRPPHNRPSPMVIVGVTVGLAGLVLLVGLDALKGDGAIDPLAVLVLTGGSLAWAFGTLYAGRASLPKSPLVTASLQLLAGGALMGVASAIGGELPKMQWDELSLRPILAMLYLIFLGSILAFTAYGWLVRVASPSRVATYAYVNPVVAMFLGWLFAGETLTLRTLVAGAVIILGVALITTGTTSQQKS